MDKGYDNERVYDACAERASSPVIPLRETPAVKRGEHKPPSCEHGEWRFAGADYKRGSDEVALPDGRVQARVGVGEGRPAASADPARDAALEGPLPGPRIS